MWIASCSGGELHHCVGDHIGAPQGFNAGNWFGKPPVSSSRSLGASITRERKTRWWWRQRWRSSWNADRYWPPVVCGMMISTFGDHWLKAPVHDRKHTSSPRDYQFPTFHPSIFATSTPDSLSSFLPKILCAPLTRSPYMLTARRLFQKFNAKQLDHPELNNLFVDGPVLDNTKMSITLKKLTNSTINMKPNN